MLPSDGTKSGAPIRKPWPTPSPKPRPPGLLPTPSVRGALRALGIDPGALYGLAKERVVEPLIATAETPYDAAKAAAKAFASTLESQPSSTPRGRAGGPRTALVFRAKELRTYVAATQAGRSLGVTAPPEDIFTPRELEFMVLRRQVAPLPPKEAKETLTRWVANIGEAEGLKAAEPWHLMVESGGDPINPFPSQEEFRFPGGPPGWSTTVPDFGVDWGETLGIFEKAGQTLLDAIPHPTGVRTVQTTRGAIPVPAGVYTPGVRDILGPLGIPPEMLYGVGKELAVEPLWAMDKAVGELFGPMAALLTEELGVEDLAKGLYTPGSIEQEMLGALVTLMAPGIGIGPGGVVKLPRQLVRAGKAAPRTVAGAVRLAMELGMHIDAWGLKQAGRAVGHAAPQVGEWLKQPSRDLFRWDTAPKAADTVKILDKVTGEVNEYSVITRDLLQTEVAKARKALSKVSEYAISPTNVKELEDRVAALQKLDDFMAATYRSSGYIVGEERDAARLAAELFEIETSARPGAVLEAMNNKQALIRAEAAEQVVEIVRPVEAKGGYRVIWELVGPELRKNAADELKVIQNVRAQLVKLQRARELYGESSNVAESLATDALRPLQALQYELPAAYQKSPVLGKLITAVVRMGKKPQTLTNIKTQLREVQAEMDTLDVQILELKSTKARETATTGRPATEAVLKRLTTGLQGEMTALRKKIQAAGSLADTSVENARIREIHSELDELGGSPISILTSQRRKLATKMADLNKRLANVEGSEEWFIGYLEKAQRNLQEQLPEGSRVWQERVVPAIQHYRATMRRLPEYETARREARAAAIEARRALKDMIPRAKRGLKGVKVPEHLGEMLLQQASKEGPGGPMYTIDRFVLRASKDGTVTPTVVLKQATPDLIEQMGHEAIRTSRLASEEAKLPRIQAAERAALDERRAAGAAFLEIKDSEDVVAVRAARNRNVASKAAYQAAKQDRITSQTKIAEMARAGGVSEAARTKTIEVPLDTLGGWKSYRVRPRREITAPTKLTGIAAKNYQLRLQRLQELEGLKKSVDRRWQSLTEELEGLQKIRDDTSLAGPDRSDAIKRSQKIEAELREMVGDSERMGARDRVDLAIDALREKMRPYETRAGAAVEGIRQASQRADERLAQIDARHAEVRDAINRMVRPLPIETTKVGGKRVGVARAWAKEDEAISDMRARVLRLGYDKMMAVIAEKTTAKGPLTPEDLEAQKQLLSNIFERDVRSTRYFQRWGEFLNRAERASMRTSAIKAIEWMTGAWEETRTVADQGAVQAAPLRWLKRHVLGAGMELPEMEGIAAHYIDMEAWAATSGKNFLESDQLIREAAVRWMKETAGEIRLQPGAAEFKAQKQIEKAEKLGGEVTDVMREQAQPKFVGEPSAGAQAALARTRRARTGAGVPVNVLARNVLKLEDEERAIEEIVRRAADKRTPAQMVKESAEYIEPWDTPAWKELFNDYDLKGAEYEFSAVEKEMVYDFISRNWVLASLYSSKGERGPVLFASNLLPQPVREVMANYRHSLTRMEALAGELHGVGADTKALLQYELRESLQPRGALHPVPDSVAAILEPSRRGLLTDILEVARNIRIGKMSKGTRRWWLATTKEGGIPSAVTGRTRGGVPEFPITLRSVFARTSDTAEGLPASILRNMNRKLLIDKMKGYLRPGAKGVLTDPKKFPNRLDFKEGYEAMASDWKKLYGMVWRDEPAFTAGAVAVDVLRRGLNALTMGVLAGDFSLMGIQFPFLVARHPRAAVKAAGMMVTNLLSDRKFGSYYANNQDLIETAVSRGLGLGLEAYTGASFRTGMIWENIPFMRPAGRAFRYVNDIQFNRMMLVMKTEAIKADLELIHGMRKMGPAITASMIPGLPGLQAINKDVDIFTGSTLDILDAVVRNINNQFGGVPRSQNQLGAMRELVEHSLLIVPGFFRARAGALTSMRRAITQPGSPEGWLAMRAMGRELMYTQIVSGMISGLSGNADEWWKARKNPQDWRSTAVFKAQLGPSGESISMAPSPSAVKLFTQLAAGREHLLSGKERLQTVKDWATGRQSVALSTLIHQIGGEDFWGVKRQSLLERTKMIVMDTAPIWMSEFMRSGEEQLLSSRFSYRELGLGTAAEFLGRSYQGPDEYKQLDNRFQAWQVQQGSQDPLEWRDSRSEDKERAKADDPEIEFLEKEWLRMKERTAGDSEINATLVSEQFDDDMNTLNQRREANSLLVEQGALSYPDWVERHKEIGLQSATVAEGFRRALTNLGLDLEGRAVEKMDLLRSGKGLPVMLALAEYRAVPLYNKPNARQVVLDDGTIVENEEPDWARRDYEREQALEGFSPEVRAQVLEEAGPTDPMEKAYRSALEGLDHYFGVIPKYKGLNPAQGRKVDFYIASVRKVEKRMREGGLSEVSRKKIYRAVLVDMAKKGYIAEPADVKLAMVAYKFALDSDTRLKYRTRESLSYIAEHLDLLRFFPWFRSEVPSLMWKYLPEDVRTEVDLEALQQRILRTEEPVPAGGYAPAAQLQTLGSPIAAP